MKRKTWVIIGLVVAGGLVVLGQPTSVSAKLRMVLVSLCTPFVKLGDYIPAVHSRRLLADENRHLQAENNLLRQQVRALSETGQENLELRRLLQFKEHPTFRAIGAQVIGRDASNWWKSLQIDQGYADGIRENMPVVNADGVVGKTVEVTAGECRVLLLTDPNCKISALLQDTRDPGVAGGGEDAFGRAPRCLMTFVDRRATVKPGEAIITSGMGGAFPKGLRVGTVVSAQLDRQSGLYQNIEVRPSVDFRRLEHVMVILSRE